MGEIPFTGNLKIGHNVEIGYYAQNQAQLLDEEITVFDTIDRVAKGDIRLKIKTSSVLSCSAEKRLKRK